MSLHSILDRNLLSLSTRDPGLAAAVTRAAEHPGMAIMQSRRGTIIPVLRTDGRVRPLYSTVDPERENARLLESHPGGGFFVCLGFGSGAHLLPLLSRNAVTGLLIIDRTIELFKSILARFDLRRLILDQRSLFLIDPAPGRIRQFIIERYNPAINGDLKSLQLRSRVDAEAEFFKNAIDELRSALEALSDDYTVQTRFGKKWFANTARNLEAAERSSTVLVPKRVAVVTAAGPSLELHFDELRRNRDERLLIATDTSLPALLASDIRPDVVVSIDCQHVSYLHFMGAYPESVPLALDLASPPVLTELTDRLLFISSGHPLSRYVSANWRRFPHVDTSGGNVTHAAVSLAAALGVQRILLCGADFSYPQGKSYTRGAYVYPWFLYRADRTCPLESQSFSFLMRAPTIVRERTDYGFRYTTKPMITYRERLEASIDGLGCSLESLGGLGHRIRTSAGRRGEARGVFSAGAPASGWRDFLQSYSDGLLSLPDPKDPVLHYLSSLGRAQRDLWTTLLPAAAFFRRSGEMDEPCRILAETRSWALSVLQHVLSSP